jgi:hypothetical protein
MYYKLGIEQPEYAPDFVVETGSAILMVQTKKNGIPIVEVQAKSTRLHAGASMLPSMPPRSTASRGSTCWSRTMKSSRTNAWSTTCASRMKVAV